MNNPLIQPDPGLFIWTIVTFLVLLALLAKFAWRPLLQALESRQERIRKSLEDAERARQELERLQQESAKIMQQARIEAESIVTQTRADAERLREELKQKAKDEADNILRNAQQQIQLQTRQAIQQIRHEVADIAVLLASKLLERNIAKEDNARLIDDTLKQIEVTKQ
ncbi:MAG: ATP synthase F0 subunit B [Acidobacteria bacterium]|nr:MAG: ATP synthase F0 subunit B [Acidobacteriota bacterium]